ncbi:MAG: hypothetical protein WKF29_01430 [Thermoleophilaceae bacterium]
MEQDEKFSGAAEESDQLPEEQPAGGVEDDAGGKGDARDEAEDSAGVPGNPGQSTGNPDNAG